MSSGNLRIRRVFMPFARRVSASGVVGAAVCAAFVVAFLFLGAAAFAGFSHVASALSLRADGDAALRALLEGAFAASVFFSFVTAAFSGVRLLFGPRDLSAVLTAPVPGEKAFSARFALLAVFASWPAVVLAAPAAVAVGASYEAGGVLVVGAVSLVAAMTIIAALAGAAASVAFSLRLRGRRARAFPAVESAACVAAAWFALHHQWFSTWAGAFVSSSDARLPGQAFGIFHAAAGLFVNAVIAAASPPAASLWCMFWPVLLAAAAGAIAAPVVARAYAVVVSAAVQTHEHRVLRSSPPVPRRPFPRILGRKHAYLFEREWLKFARDRTAVARAAAFIFVAASAMFAASQFEVPLAVAAPAALAFAGTVAIVFGLQLSFQAFAAEGGSAKTLWSSPVHKHEFYSWKFFFWSLFHSVACMAMAGLAAWAFSLPLRLAVFVLLAAPAFACSVAAVTLALGAWRRTFARRDRDGAPAAAAAASCGALLLVFVRYAERFALMETAGKTDLLSGFGLFIVASSVIGIAWAAGHRAAAASA